MMTIMRYIYYIFWWLGNQDMIHFLCVIMWCITRHLIYLIYQFSFHIHVAICLFDAIVALNVSKVKKKWIFLYFFKFAEFLPSFCRSFAEFDETLFSGPRRVVRRDEFYNTASPTHSHFISTHHHITPCASPLLTCTTLPLPCAFPWSCHQKLNKRRSTPLLCCQLEFGDSMLVL